MNNNQDRFDKFPEWLYEYDDLTAEEKLVYMKIRSLAKNRGTWASNEYFSKIFKKDISTIKRYLSKLEKKGMIERVTTLKQGYIKERMIYIVDQDRTGCKDEPSTGRTDEPSTGCKDEPSTGCKDEPSTGRTDEPSTENNLTDNYLTDNKLTDKKPMSESNDSLAEAFEKLWKLYPNKKGKKPAFTAYKRAIKKGTTNKQIQDGIVRYIAEIKKRHTPIDKVAHGSTFFNQERWLDDYDQQATVSDGGNKYSNLGW